MLMQLLGEKREGCSNSQWCQLCTARKLINQLVLLHTLFLYPLHCFTYTFHHFLPRPVIVSPSCLNHSFPSLSFSDGPDLLEGHGANRHGANRVSGRPAVPVPAQHHHCGLHGLPRRHVLHHLCAHLLPSPLHPQLGRWRAPLQVRARRVVETGKIKMTPHTEVDSLCSVTFSKTDHFQSTFFVLSLMKQTCCRFTVLTSNNKVFSGSNCGY